MVFLECGAVCFAFCGFVALRLGYVARKWMLGVGCLKFPSRIRAGEGGKECA